MNQKTNKEKTGAYPLLNVLVCPVKLDKVPDIATGGTRSRRHGIVLSMSAIPNLNEQPEPIAVQGNMQTILIDADSYEDLREKFIKEIDEMIQQMKEAAEEMKNEKGAQKVTA